MEEDETVEEDFDPCPVYGCEEEHGHTVLCPVCGIQHAEDCEICYDCDGHIEDCPTCGECGEHLDSYYDTCTECCCVDCGEEQDNCSCREFGTSPEPPWERRGIKVKAKTDKENWHLIWPDINISVDPVQAAADFYLLESMLGNVPIPLGTAVKPLVFSEESDQKFFEMCEITDPVHMEKMIKSRNDRIKELILVDPVFKLRLILASVEEALEYLVDWLDPTFQAYSHMAISGELRHHCSIGGKVLSSNRSSAWCGWRKVFDTVGNEALKDASELFHEFTGGGYGGPPWANCADVLYARLEGKLGPDGPDGKINKRMFIDRIWTLEHNGGCFLNKIGWSILNKKGYDVSYVKTLLNAHAADETDFPVLFRSASSDVQELFMEYIETAQNFQKHHGMEVTENPVPPAQTHVLCKYCWANPEYGHYAGCSVMYRRHILAFDGIVDLKIEKPWYLLLDSFELEDDIFMKAKWTKSHENNPEMIWGPDGSISLPADAKFTVKLSMTISDVKRGWQTYKTQKVVDFVQLMTKTKWHQKRFGKNKGEIGHINDYAWNVEVVYNNTPLFSFGGAGYSGDYGAQDPKQWYEKPIDVSQMIQEQVGGNKFWSIKSLEKSNVDIITEGVKPS